MDEPWNKPAPPFHTETAYFWRPGFKITVGRTDSPTALTVGFEIIWRKIYLSAFVEVFGFTLTGEAWLRECEVYTILDDKKEAQ